MIQQMDEQNYVTSKIALQISRLSKICTVKVLNKIPRSHKMVDW